MGLLDFPFNLPWEGPPFPRSRSSNPVRRLPRVDDILIISFGGSPEERLLRALFGEKGPREPELTEEVICECGKYRRVRYVGITCDRCGALVRERKVLSLPPDWTVEQGRRWYREHSKEWEYKPGWGYIRK